MTATPRRFFHGRGILPALVLTAGLLSGCGPASLRSHMPSLPHVYLFQNTALVQTALDSLALQASDIPGSAQKEGTQTTDAANALIQSKNATADAARFARWHRLDGVTSGYVLANSGPNGQSASLDPAHLEIDIGRYATDKDAEGMFHDVVSQPSMVGTTARLPDPAFGPSTGALQIVLATFTMDVVYFQERNLVVRVMNIAPTGSPLLAPTQTIAQREYARIATAK